MKLLSAAFLLVVLIPEASCGGCANPTWPSIVTSGLTTTYAKSASQSFTCYNGTFLGGATAMMLTCNAPSWLPSTYSAGCTVAAATTVAATTAATTPALTTQQTTVNTAAACATGFTYSAVAGLCVRQSQVATTMFDCHLKCMNVGGFFYGSANGTFYSSWNNVTTNGEIWPNVKCKAATGNWTMNWWEGNVTVLSNVSNPYSVNASNCSTVPYCVKLRYLGSGQLLFTLANCTEPHQCLCSTPLPGQGSTSNCTNLPPIAGASNNASTGTYVSNKIGVCSCATKSAFPDNTTSKTVNCSSGYWRGVPPTGCFATCNVSQPRSFASLNGSSLSYPGGSVAQYTCNAN